MININIHVVSILCGYSKFRGDFEVVAASGSSYYHCSFHGCISALANTEHMCASVFENKSDIKETVPLISEQLEYENFVGFFLAWNFPERKSGIIKEALSHFLSDLQLPPVTSNR